MPRERHAQLAQARVELILINFARAIAVEMLERFAQTDTLLLFRAANHITKVGDQHIGVISVQLTAVLDELGKFTVVDFPVTVHVKSFDELRKLVRADFEPHPAKLIAELSSVNPPRIVPIELLKRPLEIRSSTLSARESLDLGA